MRNASNLSALVIADDPVTLALSTRSLQQVSRTADVHGCRSAEEALVLPSAGLGLIVIDQVDQTRLVATLEMLSRNEAFRVVPKLVMVAQAEPALVADCYGARANSVLVRPDEESLDETLREAASYWLNHNHLP